MWTEDVPTTSLTDLLSGTVLTADIDMAIMQNRRWCVPLPNDGEELDVCFSLLTEAEKERVDRFRHEGARKLFIVEHGVIHLLLKEYLGNQYQEVRWMETEHHKPFIQLADSSKPLEYNL